MGCRVKRCVLFLGLGLGFKGFGIGIGANQAQVIVHDKYNPLQALATRLVGSSTNWHALKLLRRLHCCLNAVYLSIPHQQDQAVTTPILKFQTATLYCLTIITVTQIRILIVKKNIVTITTTIIV